VTGRTYTLEGIARVGQGVWQLQKQKPWGCKIGRKMNIFNEKNNFLGPTNFKLMNK
jgi:hypothetical protein